MLYIGTDDGIYRWFQGTPWPIFHGLQGRSIVGLASPGGGTLLALDTTSTVWESLNNGMEWRSIPLPEGAGRPTSLALVSAGEMIVATARPLGLFRRPIGLVSTTDAPAARVRAKRLEEAVIGGAKAIATRIRKGAGTATAERATSKELHGWTSMAFPSSNAEGIPPKVRSLSSNEGILYAAVSGHGLWSSADLGQTWSQRPGLPDDVYAVRFAPKTIAVGTSEGVKLSTDGGQTWADHSEGLEKTLQVRALEIKPGDPKVMLAGVAPKGAGEGPVADRRGLRFALFESKDAGKTWKHVTRGFPELLESDSISDIRFLPDDTNSAAIALASGEMWSTRIDGAWWEPLARQIQSARVLCAPPEGRTKMDMPELPIYEPDPEDEAGSADDDPPTILITGALGNIGSKLREAWGEAADLILIDRRDGGDPEVIAADLATWDEDWVSAFDGVDAVIHLAANASDRTPWADLVGPNLDALNNVFLAAALAGVDRLIFASSNHAMGGYREAENVPIVENLPPGPATTTEPQNWWGSRLGKAMANAFGMTVIALRIGWIQPGENRPDTLPDDWSRSIWLSNRDMLALFQAALETPLEDGEFLVVNGLSKNQGTRWSLAEAAERLEYHPEDDAYGA